MSIQAISWAIEQDDIPARPALVLISIANHADHTSGYCWLNAETIAREARCTPRSVFNYVGALVRNGYIRKAPRKGEDGKQRANDYWIMFGREQTPWEWGAHGEASEAEGEASETASSEAEPQDVVSPYASDSHGPHASGSHGEPAEVSQDSYGPHAIGFTRLDTAEPSKTNPKKEGSPFAGPPRSYRPPPLAPERPQGVIADTKTQQQFVFEGSRAWEAWVAEKRRTNGVHWTLTVTKVVDGKARRGWYFPSLFPPTAPKTDPPDKADSLMSAEDEETDIPIK